MRMVELLKDREVNVERKAVEFSLPFLRREKRFDGFGEKGYNPG